jgi:hypothetical protein
MLAPFSKTDVTVVLFGDTFEIQRIGNIIIACLKKAGWNVGTSVALGGGGSVTGIPIGVRSGSDKRTQEAAITLISALQSMGIGAGPWEFSQMQMPMTSLTGDGPHDAPVKVFIGTKP